MVTWYKCGIEPWCLFSQEATGRVGPVHAVLQQDTTVIFNEYRTCRTWHPSPSMYILEKAKQAKMIVDDAASVCDFFFI